jgi:hypothetical protein
LLLLDGQVHHDTHAVPMGNYVIGAGNYVIANPSELGNYMSADSLGISDPEDDPTVLVDAGHGGVPRLWFQLVPETRIVKIRVHLDLVSADADAEAKRLTGLGASVPATYPGWITLAAPEGNEFCMQRSESPAKAK